MTIELERAQQIEEEERLRSKLRSDIKKEKLQWLRWIAVPISAIAGYLLSQVLYSLLQLFNQDSWDFWTRLVNSALGPAAFVWAGAKTAPKYQFITSIVLAAILILLYGMLLMAGFVYKTSTPIWELILSLIIGIAASVYTVIAIKDEAK